MVIQRVNLGTISLKTEYGLTASATDRKTGHKFLRITDIRHGGIVWDQVPFCECDTKDAKKYGLQKGDVVFARTGSVGNSCLITDPPNGAVFASYLIRIRPDREKVDPQFLAYFFQTTDYWHQIESQAVGAIHQGLNASRLKQLTLPLPPLSEQQRIAGILSRADRLRRLRRYTLELSDGYLQSVFLEMFWTNAMDEWPVTDIASLARPGKGTIRTGPFGSQLLHSEFVEQGVAVLGIDNAVQNRFVWARPRFVTNEKYKKLKRYTVFPGDVLITIMGTTGRCTVVPEGIPTAINTKHLCCITCDPAECEPEFLKWAFLVHPHVRAQLEDAERGAIMPGLNMGVISGLEFPLPPLSRQRQFVDAVRNTERLREQQREALRQAEHLFQTLLHGAFRGEV